MSILSFESVLVSSAQSHLDISLPERRFAVLSVSVVVENTVRFALGVVSLARVPIMDCSVDGSSCQGRNTHGNSDDGHGR